jgi:hypothetical protein
MVKTLRPLFRTFTVALDVAHVEGNAERLDFAGNYWYVVNASSDSAIAQVALDVNSLARLPAMLHRGYRGRQAFKRLWIFNDAQPEAWVDIVIAQDPDFQIIAQAGRPVIEEVTLIAKAVGHCDNTLATGQTGAIAAATPVQVVPARVGRSALIVTNYATEQVGFVGFTDAVTAANGFPVYLRGTVSITNYEGPLWCYFTAGNAVGMMYLEKYTA